MGNVKATYLATVLAGLLALFAPAGAAEAAPTDGSRAAAVESICDTGYRGQREYDAKCLVTGTFKSGAMLWLSIPKGKAGHVGRGDFTRRSICQYPGKSGLHAAVREALFDVAYDRYRNHTSVLRWAGDVAALDCKVMGYKISKI